MPRKQAAQVLGPRGPKVTVVKVEGPWFLTLGPDDLLWKMLLLPPLVPSDDMPRFVRLYPSPEFSQDHIAKVREFYESHGADVQVITPQSPQVVLDQATPAYDDEGIRETVTVMAEESNSQNKPALRNLLEATMTEVGL